MGQCGAGAAAGRGRRCGKRRSGAPGPPCARSFGWLWCTGAPLTQSTYPASGARRSLSTCCLEHSDFAFRIQSRLQLQGLLPSLCFVSQSWSISHHIDQSFQKCLIAGLQHLDGPGMGGGMRGGMHVGPGDPLFDSRLRQGGPRGPGGPPSGARFDPINPQGLPVRHCCRIGSSASLALSRPSYRVAVDCCSSQL